MVLNHAEKTVASAMFSLMDVQGYIALNLHGVIPGSKEMVAPYAFALTEEVHEIARELEWRPWREDKTPDVDRVVSEFSDLLAFVGVLANIAAIKCGVEVEEFAEMLGVGYKHVSAKNIRRFEKGPAKQPQDAG